MKKILLGLLVMIFTGLSAQTPVKSRKLKGEWELQIQVLEAVAEETEDLGVFGKMLAGAVAGFVDVALESVDVFFDFYNKNNVRLKVKTDNDAPEIESLSYRIC